MIFTLDKFLVPKNSICYSYVNLCFIKNKSSFEVGHMGNEVKTMSKLIRYENREYDFSTIYCYTLCTYA